MSHRKYSIYISFRIWSLLMNVISANREVNYDYWNGI